MGLHLILGQKEVRAIKRHVLLLNFKWTQDMGHFVGDFATVSPHIPRLLLLILLHYLLVDGPSLQEFGGEEARLADTPFLLPPSSRGRRLAASISAPFEVPVFLRRTSMVADSTGVPVGNTPASPSQYDDAREAGTIPSLCAGPLRSETPR